MSTAAARITCLCGRVSEPGDLLPGSHFPLLTGLCNCNACRHSIGTLGCSSIVIKSAPSETSLNECLAYVSNKHMTRYFCRTCGTKIFFHIQRDGNSKWAILPGVIDRSDTDQVDTIEINQTWFVLDAGDGGLARRIFDNMTIKAVGSPHPQGFKLYGEGRPQSPRTPFDQAEQLWSKPQKPEDVPPFRDGGKVDASCHCEGVQFMIIQPDATKNNLKAVDSFLSQNNTKYIAKFCTCRSCRLATGLPLQPWTYVPPENILTMSGEPIDFDFDEDLKALPGIRVFRSSEGVRRSFCGTCGATVFFDKTARPELIDVSMGLLRSQYGALAADVVEWKWTDVSHRNECRDQKYLSMLAGPPKPQPNL